MACRGVEDGQQLVRVMFEPTNAGAPVVRAQVVSESSDVHVVFKIERETVFHVIRLLARSLPYGTDGLDMYCNSLSKMEIVAALGERIQWLYCASAVGRHLATKQLSEVIDSFERLSSCERSVNVALGLKKETCEQRNGISFAPRDKLPKIRIPPDIS